MKFLENFNLGKGNENNSYWIIRLQNFEVFIHPLIWKASQLKAILTNFWIATMLNLNFSTVNFTSEE